jgi:hypothetical protein
MPQHDGLYPQAIPAALFDVHQREQRLPPDLKVVLCAGVNAMAAPPRAWRFASDSSVNPPVACGRIKTGPNRDRRERDGIEVVKNPDSPGVRHECRKKRF